MLSSMIGLLVFSAFVTIGIVEGCGFEADRKLEECDAHMGYNHRASLGGPGDVWNFTQLINYCRAPERLDLGQCWISALDGCDMGWLEEVQALYVETLHWAGKGVDYLCSEVGVLERFEPCLSGVNHQITLCIQSSHRASVVRHYSSDEEYARQAISYRFMSYKHKLMCGIFGRECVLKEDPQY